MILCHAYTPEPNLTFLLEPPNSSYPKLRLRLTPKHWRKLQKSCGGFVGEIGEPRGDKNFTSRARESSDLDPWVFSETEPPIKMHSWLVLHSPPTHKQLDIQTPYPRNGAGRVPDSVACLWILFPKLGCLSL